MTQTYEVESLASQPTEASDERLARFRLLFERNFSYVWASLGRLGVAERDREDVANDVFFAVYRKLDQFDRSRAERPWLFAFAAGIAADYRRLARHRVELVAEHSEVPSDAPQGEELVTERERHALVDAALEHVDEEKRVILIMHQLDDIPIPDVARALGIPEGTAYSRLRAAREQFGAAVRRIQLRKKERP